WNVCWYSHPSPGRERPAEDLRRQVRGQLSVLSGLSVLQNFRHNIWKSCQNATLESARRRLLRLSPTLSRGMLAGVRAIAPALAMVSVSFAAVAQVVPPGAQIVPPSDQPGRERERFERPAVPLAQPSGPAISVPGIEAPPGAAETKLVIRQIRII